MNISEAVELMREGKRMTRGDWYDLHMCRGGWDGGHTKWICYMPPTVIQEDKINSRTKPFWPSGDMNVNGYFVRVKVKNDLWCPGWSPTAEDILANDWMEYDE